MGLGCHIDRECGRERPARALWLLVNWSEDAGTQPHGRDARAHIEADIESH